MKTCIVEIQSVSPYSASRKHNEEKLEKEGADAYDKRTWREKCHYDANGVAFIPGIAFKFALDAAAKYLSLSIPGKGKATYTKHFLSGVMCPENLSLGKAREDVTGISLSLNADGVRGSGKRVDRILPQFPKWGGKLTFYVFDEQITKDVFERVMVEAGKFIGVGQFRPQNGGHNGRFEVKGFQWSDA